MRALLLASVVLALGGCATTQQDDGLDHQLGAPVEDVEGDSGETGSGLILRAVGGDGEVTPMPFPFGDKRGVHIRILGTPSALNVLDANYSFQVEDEAGRIVSTDERQCRMFHLNQLGRIDAMVAARDSAGLPCDHAFGIGDNNRLLPQLIPFDDVAVDADGTMHYVVRVTPDTAFGAKAELTTTFSVTAPEPPTCGDGVVDDGEVCDDGNHEDHDGCRTDCTKDPCHSS